jgi:preprotein translocase subunit SecA
MFAAMMDAIKEESVGFLFNLEVQVDAEPVAPDDIVTVPPVDDLDAVLADVDVLEDGRLTAEAPTGVGVGADELHAEAVLAALATGQPSRNGDHPHIFAKGLDRSDGAAPLTYRAPELGSDTPEVHVEGGAAAEAGPRAAGARQRRSNPNRGSRGNKRRR